jgi:hypothetical protein
MVVSRILLSVRYVSDKSCWENQNTHFMFDNLFIGNYSDYEIMWKQYFRAGQATDDSMAHAFFMLGN